MGIGTPVAIAGASGNANSGAANATTTTTAASIGDLIVMNFGNAVNNDTFSSLTDNHGNTYSLLQGVRAAGTTNGGIGWAFTNAALPTGTSFTASTTGAGAWNFNGVWKISGATGGVDTQNQATLGVNSTGTSQSTGALQINSQIIFGATTINNTETYTEDAAFTNLFGAGAGSNGGFGYKIVTSAASVTWAPSWTPATTQTVPWQLVSFMASPPFGWETSGSLFVPQQTRRGSGGSPR